MQGGTFFTLADVKEFDISKMQQNAIETDLNLKDFKTSRRT